MTPELTVVEFFLLSNSCIVLIVKYLPIKTSISNFVLMLKQNKNFKKLQDM